MKYIIDENGFLLYASVLPTTKTHTEIKYEGTFLKPKLVNKKWIEGATTDEINAKKEAQTKLLREEFSKKIDALVNEAVQRKVRTGEEIPVEIEYMVKVLKQEYKDKIAEL